MVPVKMFSKCLLVFLLCFASQFSVDYAAELEFTVEIEPSRRECFHQEIKKGTSFEFEYQVIDGGELDVNFMIQSPGGRVIVTDIRKTENMHRLDADEDGDFSFCLDNTFSRFSSKLVFFELITDDGDAEEDEFADLPQDSELEIKLEDFKMSLTKIKEHVDKGRQLQNVLRAIELRDRSLQEANFERVNFWSGVQIFIMFSVAITHVLMIRSLFEDRQGSKLKVRT